jgi:hypothetical protein
MRLLPVLFSICALASHAPTLRAQTGPSLCFPEEAELVARDGQDADRLGTAVAIDGDTAVLGAVRDDDLGFESGSASVFLFNGSTWINETKLLATDGTVPHYFGVSVDVHEDTAVVGATGEYDRGAAYVFARQGGAWEQQARLIPFDAFDYQNFGISVAVEGNTVIVGAHAPLVHGATGAVYVFVRQAGMWGLQQKIPDTTSGWTDHKFGVSVSISGDLIALAAPGSSPLDMQSGTVLVYRRLEGTWALEATLVPQNGGHKHYFGTSVSIDGDTLVAASPNAGFVYVFECQSGIWFETDQLVRSDGGSYIDFGGSVAVSGDTFAVGAWRDDMNGYDSGSAYIFQRTGASWTELAKIAPAADANIFDAFGCSVAVDGHRALIGRRGASEIGYDRGAGHVFSLPPSAGATYCDCARGPCGNGFGGAGCANSTGDGAHLLALGRTDPDEVTLLITGAVPGELALFFQADGQVDLPFGDGMRCAAGGLITLSRTPSQIDARGITGYGSCFGDSPISLQTGVVPGSGVTKYYQSWYRDAAGPCGSSFNLTNGVMITW